jgi:hypothetical protein
MRMEIRYPPEGCTEQELRAWRMDEKRRLLAERGWNCQRCGARAATDLDEGIVPKSSMRGLSLEQKRIAFGSPNLFLLCSRCNREEAHQQEWAFGQSCYRYGEDTVRDWYASIGFKTPEQRFMPKKLTKCTE